MVQANINDPEFVEELKGKIEDTKMVNHLCACRMQAGLSQAEMARRMKCSQSRISKIENGYDSQLKLKDILDYAQALKQNVSFEFNPQKVTLVDQIKVHAMQIDQKLQQLAEMAHMDEKIAEGVTKFYGDYLYNTLSLFQSNLEKMPNAKQKRELLTVTSTEDKAITEKVSV